MAHFIENGRATSLIEVDLNGDATVDLFIEAPYDTVEVVASDPTVFTVTEVPASVAANVRRFLLRGRRQASARVLARLLRGADILAEARVVVGRGELFHYYHATSSENADTLLDLDLTPRLLEQLYRGAVTRFDWTDYTDFGKGFYVHLEANRRLAYEWARRHNGENWAVVEFLATADELRSLWPTALHFADKADRPHNSPEQVTITRTMRRTAICPVPQLLPCVEITRRTRTVTSRRMNWLEFVEHNRHLAHSATLIARPNDRDWTDRFSRIRGPIWVPRDSGIDAGGRPFPDRVHQLNWGRAGMTVLNAPELKRRRFKYWRGNPEVHPVW